MKKILISSLLLLCISMAVAQKASTRTGEAKFEASMPSFEEVAASNNTVSAILEKPTGNFAALVLIKAFKFKAPLMEEHFNENYMESTKFPKATFKGKILNFDASKLSAAKTAYDLEGEFTLHGVTKKIKTRISLSLLASGKISAASSFKVRPQDYGIAIPNLVKNKIADNVDVSVNFVLE